MTRVHIVGAGLAGLAAAVRLARKGVSVTVYEAAPHAGGRCRSFHDAKLGTLIDNGNHLIMSGNRAALGYLDEIGAADTLEGSERARFPFVDLATGERWTVAPGGALPFWLLDPARRVPGTSVADYAGALRLLAAGGDRTVAETVKTDGPLWQLFWEPLTLAAINAAPERASAALLRAVLLRTFAKGERYCRPLVAKEGLGQSFIEPALAMLERAGAQLRFNARIRALETESGAVTALRVGGARVVVRAGESVVLAVPPRRAQELVPSLEVPGPGETIVNVHYKLAAPVPRVEGSPFLGLVNARAHWAFVRGSIVSLTVSAADDMADEAAEALVPELWKETVRAFCLGERRYEAARVIKERRATFDQSPEGVRRRPGTRTAVRNLYLAGDWTDTGLPATIEGAIRSGQKAARLLKA